MLRKIYFSGLVGMFLALIYTFVSSFLFPIWEKDIIFLLFFYGISYGIAGFLLGSFFSFFLSFFYNRFEKLSFRYFIIILCGFLSGFVGGGSIALVRYLDTRFFVREGIIPYGFYPGFIFAQLRIIFGWCLIGLIVGIVSVLYDWIKGNKSIQLGRVFKISFHLLGGGIFVILCIGIIIFLC